MDDSTTIIYKYDFFIRFLMKRKEEEEEKWRSIENQIMNCNVYQS